jgi:hypothetical protein
MQIVYIDLIKCMKGEYIKISKLLRKYAHFIIFVITFLYI